MTSLARVLWIGGGTGAGKSSIAIALAEKFGLERYNYDWHDARDHSARTRPDRHPSRAAFLAMSMDERWVTRTPTQMRDEALADFGERLEMVLEDLAAMSSDGVVADGFGLLPELIVPLLGDRRQAVFLLATPEFREQALARRGWLTVEGTSDPERARANKLARDALLTEHVRATARQCGLMTIDVDGNETLTEVIARVEQHFAPSLV